VIEAYARGGGREGLLITRAGKLCGFIMNRQLLAKQTRTAAGTIATHTRAIHGAAREVAQGHGGMQEVIERIGRIARSVDDSIAPQTEITREVARAAAESAAANEEITRSIHSIGENAATASSASIEMESRALDLSASADRLQGRIASFTELVQAA
jgi:methyl-accepting chemotaxis protein